MLDPFARFMKVLVLIGSIAAIIMSTGYARDQGFARFEYPLLIVIATLGMMMMISANDLIALYLGLELQSLSLYVIAAINRDSVRSTEAGLKYFVLGALSSGMLLYGASLIYGFTGHTSFAGIAAALSGGTATLGMIFGLVFLDRRSCLQGLGGAVPHVDARRLRGRADAGDGLLRRRAEGGGDGAVHPRRRRPVRVDHAGLAADPRPSSRSPRWCSAPSPRSGSATSSA